MRIIWRGENVNKKAGKLYIFDEHGAKRIRTGIGLYLKRLGGNAMDRMAEYNTYRLFRKTNPDKQQKSVEALLRHNFITQTQAVSLLISGKIKNSAAEKMLAAKITDKEQALGVLKTATLGSGIELYMEGNNAFCEVAKDIECLKELVGAKSPNHGFIKLAAQGLAATVSADDAPALVKVALYAEKRHSDTETLWMGVLAPVIDKLSARANDVSQYSDGLAAEDKARDAQMREVLSELAKESSLDISESPLQLRAAQKYFSKGRPDAHFASRVVEALGSGGLMDRTKHWFVELLVPVMIQSTDEGWLHYMKEIVNGKPFCDVLANGRVLAGNDLVTLLSLREWANQGARDSIDAISARITSMYGVIVNSVQ